MSQQAKIRLRIWLQEVRVSKRLVRLRSQLVLIRSDRTTRSKTTSKVAKIRVRMVRVDVEATEVEATLGVGDNSDSKEVSRASTLTNKSSSRHFSPSKL